MGFELGTFRFLLQRLNPLGQQNAAISPTKFVDVIHVNNRVLCCRSYTSPGLVLFGSIFNWIFYFIFLAFKLYHIVDHSTIQCFLSVFDVSLTITESVQNQFQFIQNRTKCLPGEMPYTVS